MGTGIPAVLFKERLSSERSLSEMDQAIKCRA
jgi:hypothetical protein